MAEIFLKKGNSKRAVVGNIAKFGIIIKESKALELLDILCGNEIFLFLTKEDLWSY